MEVAEHIDTEYRKFSLLYDNAPIGYFTLDSKANILKTNNKGFCMLGLEETDTSNLNFKNFIKHDFLVAFIANLNATFETRQKQNCTLSLITQEDSEIFTEIEFFLIDDYQCVLTAMDVKNVRKLKELELRFRKLFETSLDGIILLNADNGIVLDMNHVISELLQINQEELLGKKIWNIGVFKSIVDSEDTFFRLKQKSDIQFYTLKLNNEKAIEVEVVSNTFQYDGKKEIQCNIRDISERRRIEKELEQNKARLEELNTSKDKFFSIISHDLRSPFNCIIGFCELMINKIDHKDYKGIEEYADKIQKSSWHAMDLLTNLIEWSKSQSGKMEFKPEVFYLKDLVDEVVQFTSGPAEQKGIMVSYNIVDDLIIEADKAMLNTILRNLISNSIKFTNPKGFIYITAVQNPSETLISVLDNGVGMPPEKTDKLFKIEESKSTKGTFDEKGTGLGLLLCKEFVCQHGGEIWVESIVDMGSRFNFTIPKF